MLTLCDRFRRLPAIELDKQLTLCPGAIHDYDALSQYHYRAGRPATAARVLVLKHNRPTVADRYQRRPARVGVVAVLVESLPVLQCRQRDWALGDRYKPITRPRQRAMLLTAELRCISRVVVHPQWRGLGLAVRLVQAALDDPQAPFTEAIAAMGKVHPFFEHAGMTAYPRPPHRHDARMVAALEKAGFDLLDLARLSHLLGSINALSGSTRRWVRHELHRWYRQTIGRSRQHSTDPRDHLLLARQQLLSEPVYYFHVNRSFRSSQTPDPENAGEASCVPPVDGRIDNRPAGCRRI